MRLIIRYLTLTGLLLPLCGATSWAAQPPSVSVTGAPPQPAASHKLSPGDIMYHVLVAELAARRGQLKTALTQYGLVVNGSSDPQLAARATQIAMFADQPKALLEMARRWYQLAPDDGHAQQALALALLRSGKVDEAVDYLDQVRAELAKHDQQDGFGALASLLGRLQDKGLALRVLTALSKRHPQSPYGHYYQALAAASDNQLKLALASVGQALAHKPDWTQALLLQAQVRVELKRTDAAVTGLAAAVKRQPDDADLRLGYARLLVTAGKLGAAQTEFQELATRHPDNAEALFALGVLATDAKQYQQAREYLQRVIKLGHRVGDSEYELGRIAELQGDYKTARHWYQQVPGDSERWLSAQARAAVMDGRLGDLDAMRQQFNQLRASNPDSAVSLYITEADALTAAKHGQGAFTLLTQALAHHPRNHDLLYSRALTAERLDKLDVAEQDLRKIIKDDPNNGQALNALGYTLADRTDRYQEALKLIQRAYKLLPDDAAVIDSMGWVQHRLGHNSEALKYLREAVAKSDEPEIVVHLVKVLLALGHQDEARKVWEKAYKTHPDNHYLLQLKPRLAP